MSDFMESFKNVINDAANALSDAAKDVSGSVKEYSDVSKLKRAVKNEESKINKYYAQIGKTVFDSNPIPPSGMEAQFTGIKNAHAEITRLNAEIAMHDKKTQ